MKAVCGCDYIRDENWKPKERSLNSWHLWAKREAKKKSKREKFSWHPVLCFVESRNAIRINFAGQPEKII